MEEMAQPHDVDRTAPVLAHHEIDIEAPLERVWALHTHVDRWPEWQMGITEARIDGQPGSVTSRRQPNLATEGAGLPSQSSAEGRR